MRLDEETRTLSWAVNDHGGCLPGQYLGREDSKSKMDLELAGVFT